MKIWHGLLAILIFASSCETGNVDYGKEAANPIFYHETVQNLTDIIVYDIFSPPVASRNYVYPTIAAYEVIAQKDQRFVSLVGQVHELEAVPQMEEGKEYSLPLAAIQAHISTSRNFIFSEDKLDAFGAKILKKFRDTGMPSDVYKRSVEFGEEMAKHIIKWSDGDNYKETRTAERFEVLPDVEGRWAPTPPDYMDGIEPHWNDIRTFVLDSANQYVPAPPPGFSIEKGTEFYEDIMEVYEAVKSLDEEKSEIAKFWDCNPYATQHFGHVMYATKKITPGGHWVGITKIACQEANADFSESVHAYMRTSIALADAFISCWDEKYRSNLIRPETVINQHFDEDWRPLLQTPPFPEYTSGHSVISRAAAETLTEIFGEPFEFADSTEVAYGLPVRNYKSFREASEEAAISRLYGGIHYMPAIYEGVSQGEKVGKFINSRLKTRQESSTLSEK